MQRIPVSYSVICTNALLDKIIPQFKIEKALNCEFWCQGLNDTYKVNTSSKTYILRIYRYNWRTQAQINFEIDALLHLQTNGSDIAYPISTHKGNYIVDLEAPEGLRYAILTHHIVGSELDFSRSESAVLYAQHIAQLHLNSRHFNSIHKRFQLDVKHLITEPLYRIKPFLKHHDWQFIESYSQILSEKLKNALNKPHQISLCHGDFSGGNAHSYRGKVASFDFDCCGLGLRSYDLAVFKWSLAVNNKKGVIWQRFLQSYQQQYPLQDDEIALIDSLVSVRHIWLMGLHIDVAVAKGWLDDHYFKQKITFLREQQLLEN